MCNAQRARLVHAKIVVAFLAALSWHAAIAAADDATLLRVFLKDGSSLVSYGEPARGEDRVVFSIPTAATPEPAQRLAIVERARRTLAAWPEDHFNYRLAEVRQMLAMLDEAIADLRASTGARRFDLTLSASVEPLTIAEPLLPPPSPKEAIEAVLSAARAVDSSVERTSLLTTALLNLDRDKAVLPADWVVKTR